MSAYADDLDALHDAHMSALREFLHMPTLLTQRVVERVSFLPSGGESWRREVQIRMPLAKNPSDEDPQGGFVVSLGLFRRARFPDFVVEDAQGRRLPLVTRDQHRYGVVVATLMKYLVEDEWNDVESRMSEEPATRDALRRVYELMGRLVTDVAGDHEVGGMGRFNIEEIETAAREFFEAMDVPEAVQKAADVGEDCRQLAHFTHYLCWVPATWGETVTLSATYTMVDEVWVAGEPRKALLATVADEDLEDDEATGWQRLRMRFYSRFGLSPVSYDFLVPAHDHTGSYYFSLEPPADAHVSLLDWGSGRDFGQKAGEVDSAFRTCHIHNATAGARTGGSRPSQIPKSKISAFLKSDPVDNSPLLAVAILNVALAYLAQRGAFMPRVEGQQQWLLLAPAILVALIAQHRSRYYSEVTRPLRGMMWTYLAINVAFGASVAFDVFERGGATIDVFGGIVLDDLASGGMACLSLGLAILLVSSGGSFERVSRGLYERGSQRSSKYSYLDATRRYADVAAATIVVFMLVAGVGMALVDWGSGRRAEAELAFERVSDTVNHRPPQHDAYNLDRPDFDIFLAYNAADRLAVQRLAELLRGEGLKPWLADEQIPPGRWFQTDLEQAVDRVGATAIVIGEHGLGRWQAVELQAFMAESVERGLPVIPVLLPNATIPGELKFLRQLTWVQFNRDLGDRDALAHLRWGITGERNDGSR